MYPVSRSPTTIERSSPYLHQRYVTTTQMAASRRSWSALRGLMMRPWAMVFTKLRSAPSLSLAEVPASEEFAVIVTRRGADGRHEPVAIIDDETLVERAIRRAV